jgi:hypothetical protein
MQHVPCVFFILLLRSSRTSEREDGCQTIQDCFHVRTVQMDPRDDLG